MYVVSQDIGIIIRVHRLYVADNSSMAGYEIRHKEVGVKSLNMLFLAATRPRMRRLRKCVR